MRIPLGQYVCLLDEGLARALWLIAAKAADPQIDNSLPTSDREIAKMTLVVTVECFRPSATAWAVCACRLTSDGDVDDLATQLYLLDNEPSARRQQHLRIHRPPLGWPSDPPGRRGLPE